MHRPLIGVGHRRPAHLAIVAAGVTCAITGREQPMLRCSSCSYFQGMLVGPEPCVLCAAPAHPPGRRAPGRRRPSLIFDQEWPDEAE